MRRTATAVIVAMALFAGWERAASAQEKGSAAAPADAAAEEAFLKAYFAEKELKDDASAEKAYAAIVDSSPGAREVVARSLLGRARCLRRLDRAAEAAPLYARVESEFADFKALAAEAHQAAQPTTKKAASVEDQIDAALGTLYVRNGPGYSWQFEVEKHGERAIPVLARNLRGTEADRVLRAAWHLLRLDTPEAASALRDAVADPALAFPTQVAKALDEVGAAAPDEILRAAAVSPNRAIRTSALRAAFTAARPAEWVSGAILKDPPTARSILAGWDASFPLGRLLVDAVAAGPGPVRDAALKRLTQVLELRSTFSANPWIAPLLDPPPAFLADREAIRAVWSELAWSAGEASAALMRALFDDRETELAGLRLAFHGGDADGVDPDKFVEVLVRREFSAATVNWSHADQIRRLVKLLGSPPTPERLRRVAAVFPEDGDWLTFLKSVAQAGGAGEANLTALVDGAATPRLRKAAIEWLTYYADPAAPWLAACFAKWLDPEDLKTEFSVTVAALQGLGRVTGRPGFDIAAHAPAVGRLLDTTAVHEAALILRKLGEPGLREFRARIAAGRRPAPVVLNELGLARDAESAARVQQILLSSTDDAEIGAAAYASMRIRGAEAQETLLQAVRRDEGAHARSIVLATAADAVASMGEFPATQFLCGVVEAAPGRVGWQPWDVAHADEPVDQTLSHYPTTALRAIVLRALQSSAVDDRRWAADCELRLLDVAAWDDLMKAAADLDAYVRDKAFEALRCIRNNENELRQLKSLADERATRERIRNMLASEDQRTRLAGIAAVVATHDETQLPELIRMAAEESVHAIADEARRALMAFGSSLTTAEKK